METLVLSVLQNVEEMRQKLIARHKRPVYLCAWNSTGSNLIRLPGEESFSKINILYQRLSKFNFKHIKREDNNYYSEAYVSSSLKFAIPISRNEKANLEKFPYPNQDNPFKIINLESYYPRTDILRLNDLSEVPEELTPYIDDYKFSNYSKVEWHKGIAFTTSQYFENPEIKSVKWQYGEVFQKFFYDGPRSPIYTRLQSPGKYFELPQTLTKETNSPIVFEERPGKCLVCRGDSNEHKHIAFITPNTSDSVHLILCRACFKIASSQWLTLMDYIPKDVEPKKKQI